MIILRPTRQVVWASLRAADDDDDQGDDGLCFRPGQLQWARNYRAGGRLGAQASRAKPSQAEPSRATRTGRAPAGWRAPQRAV